MIYAENIFICIAVPLLISLLFAEGSARGFIASFLTGTAVCLLSAYISGFLQIVSGMSVSDTAVFLSPVVEEIMKFLPMLFVLFIFMPEDSGLFIAAIGIGAGFATFENCCYLLSSGAASLRYMLIRGLAVGVMHIISMLTLAFGLVLVRRVRLLSLPGIAGAFSLSVIFHGLYNLLVSEPGISSAIGYILPLATAALLYFPYRSLRRTGVLF
ncbi:MAG: PrsW family intramembrane metalloprotease [Eubacterium sp.]|nr:PrsW family intramembrane metalloprotease [Bacillota bacterium]MBQ1484682.1 PrsW family intramembrane metalloprotease [Eubacterium sp.]